MDVVRQLAKKHEVNPAVLEALLPPDQRERSVDSIQEYAVRNGIQLERRALIHVLKDLDDSGLGTFVVGRRGHQSRFCWADRVAEGHAQDLPTESTETSPIDKEEANAESIQHRFTLRPGFEVELALPGDLTQTEAKRLATFISALPFGDERRG